MFKTDVEAANAFLNKIDQLKAEIAKKSLAKKR